MTDHGRRLVSEVAQQVARETLGQPLTLPPGFGEQTYTVCNPSRVTLGDVAEIMAEADAAWWRWESARDRSGNGNHLVWITEPPG